MPRRRRARQQRLMSPRSVSIVPESLSTSRRGSGRWRDVIGWKDFSNRLRGSKLDPDHSVELYDSGQFSTKRTEIRRERNRKQSGDSRGGGQYRWGRNDTASKTGSLRNHGRPGIMVTTETPRRLAANLESLVRGWSLIPFLMEDWDNHPPLNLRLVPA